MALDHPMNQALRRAAGQVPAEPARDQTGRFAAASNPLEAYAAVKGARRPATIARLLTEDGVDIDIRLSELRRDHPELFDPLAGGSADGGAGRGMAPQVPSNPIDDYKRSRSLL